MILPFSTTWPKRMGDLAGKPTLFTNKISKCLWNTHPKEYNHFINNQTEKQKQKFDLVKPFGEISVFETEKLVPKLHTIRKKRKGKVQWEEGRDIQMVINHRAKNQFQFAPTIKCTGVQSLLIGYIDDYPIIHLGDTQQSCMPFYWENPKDEEDGYGVDQMKELAINGGFPSIEAFFRYFNADSEGEYELIHWTDKRY